MQGLQHNDLTLKSIYVSKSCKCLNHWQDCKLGSQAYKKQILVVSSIPYKQIKCHDIYFSWF